MPEVKSKHTKKNVKSSDGHLLKRTDDKKSDLKAHLVEIPGDDDDLIQIHRAAKVITCIANGVNTLSEIGEYCGLSKSSVHRLLKALEKSHFIIYNDFNRRYMIGEMFTDIATNPEIYYDYLYLCSGNEMEDLARYTQETIILLVLVGLRQFKVRSIPSPHDLRVFEGIRSSRPVFAGAGSEVLLSQLDDEALNSALKTIQWVKVTDRSLINQRSLMVRLKKMRRDGYAISSGERISGAVCIAVPVKNYSLPAALLLLAPQFRMKGKQAEYLELMLKKAKEIEANLTSLMGSRSPEKPVPSQGE
jgi:DNA-binding IclR family transcriptional regulator